MKFNNFAAYVMVSALIPAAANAADNDCGMLVGTSRTTDATASAAAAQAGFPLRDGTAVDFVHGAKTVHGTLLVFGDNGAFRAYWQPEHSAEKYALANADDVSGSNTVRLVSTPPQGVPVKNGEPGTMLAPQRVVSCPAM